MGGRRVGLRQKDSLLKVSKGLGLRGLILLVAAGYNFSSWSYSKPLTPLLSNFSYSIFFLVQKCVMYIIEKKTIKHSRHFPLKKSLIPDFPIFLSSDHKTTIFLLCMSVFVVKKILVWYRTILLLY